MEVVWGVSLHDCRSLSQPGVQFFNFIHRKGIVVFHCPHQHYISASSSAIGVHVAPVSPCLILTMYGAVWETRIAAHPSSLPPRPSSNSHQWSVAYERETAIDILGVYFVTSGLGLRGE